VYPKIILFTQYYVVRMFVIECALRRRSWASFTGSSFTDRLSYR